MLLSASLLSLAWLSLAHAQNAVDNLSFGHKQAISPNSFAVPGWSTLGEGYMPQILSDKVILTPPYGGNKRGALWSEAKNTLSSWTGKLDFRAGGVDHGKGNLALWFVRDGNTAINTASIYTVGKFDGMALVVDTNGGVQKIRGFLNDGSTDFNKHANVDSLAFGHCDYHYRNLGRPSTLLLTSFDGGLDVTIDGLPCFSTNKIALPSSDYGFGVTAASADPPDSFEVFKFEVAPTGAAGVTSQSPPGTKQNDLRKSEDIRAPLGTRPSSDASYQSLVQKFDTLEQSVTNIVAELNRYSEANDARFKDIVQLLRTPAPDGNKNTNAMLGNLESRLGAMDRAISSLSGSISSDIKSSLNHDEKFAHIQQQLQMTHDGITHHLPSKMRDYVQNHTPRIGFIVFSFMAFQSCCLAVLLWQKYRKSSMPKKYL